MKNNWKPKTIKIKDLERKMTDNEIAVPTYQRGVVWSKDMQINLIDSIKNGYPFGSLIMFNYEEEKKPLLLIDGLQRSTALFKFVNNPTEYFGPLDVSDTCAEQLGIVLGFQEPSESLVKSIKTKLIDWVKLLNGSDAIEKMEVYDCASYIANNFRVEGKDPNNYEFLTDIKKVIQPVFDNFKDIYGSIVEREIPYIEITGDDDGLSDIFFRINDKGIKLSKENKFAATWANRSIKISKEKLYEFVKIISDRYDAIQSGGTSIFGYNHQEFIDNKTLDVFELCHAFGKYIKKYYPELFGKIKDDNKSEPIGFTLLNSCLMGKKESLPEMNKLLFKMFDNDDDINLFISKVLSCIKYVDSLLAPYLKFKSNKRIGGTQLHTDQQICSIVASVFRLEHTSELENGEFSYNLTGTNNDWTKYDTLLRKNLIKRYLSDILNNVWGAHGDATLNNIILNNSDYYTREISSSDLRATLYNWFSMYKMNNKEYTEKSIKSPSSADKLILSIIYSDTFNASMQLSAEKFDIEHIFPKKMAERMLKEFKGELKLTLSSIGNLCLLPEYTNRKKKDKTVYDDIEYRNKLGDDFTIEEIENKYTFTKESQLQWTKQQGLTMNDIESKYNSFIDERFEQIVSKLISIIYR